MKSPKEIVALMFEKDAFSIFLGMEVKQIELGFCELSLKVRSDLVNGFQIAHGGITFSLADSALAFASNSRGNKCVSIETSISHLKKVNIGDVLFAKCKEIHRGRKIGVYVVEIKNQNDHLVALFKGTVNVSEEMW